MDQSQSDNPEGAAARAGHADAGAPSGASGPGRRFSAARELAAATRLLRGEPLETVARELNGKRGDEARLPALTANVLGRPGAWSFGPTLWSTSAMTRGTAAIVG